MSSVTYPFDALLLTSVDFVVAALLYHLVSTSLALLVALAGTLLLSSLLYQFSRRFPRSDDRELAR